jgi:hypothetical protein
MGRIINTRYPPPIEAELDKMPDKQAFIREAVATKLEANKSRLPSPGVHPETDLQTLATLNPKECSFQVNGQICTGTIAAVLVNWETGKIGAVLVNTADSQVQIPIAKVTILPE